MDGWNPIVSFFVWLPGRRFRLLVSGTVASSAQSPLGIRAGPKHAVPIIPTNFSCQTARRYVYIQIAKSQNTGNAPRPEMIVVVSRLPTRNPEGEEYILWGLVRIVEKMEKGYTNRKNSMTISKKKSPTNINPRRRHDNLDTAYVSCGKN